MMSFWSWHSAVGCLLQKGPGGPMSKSSTQRQNDTGSEVQHSDATEFADEWDDYIRTDYPFLVFDERGEYSQLTGSSYLRCIECESEMPTGAAIDGGFVHYRGCPIARNPDERANDASNIGHRESSIWMEGLQ